MKLGRKNNQTPTLQKSDPALLYKIQNLLSKSWKSLKKNLTMTVLSVRSTTTTTTITTTQSTKDGHKCQC